MPKRVRPAFQSKGVLLPLAAILPLRQLKPTIKASSKFQQILTSIREVGLVEPLVVYPPEGSEKSYVLMDGHLRLEALKALGETVVPCLLSTDDEAYTYNKRINPLATIQEHSMILQAIKSGIKEEKIARTLNVDVKSIVQRRDLLNGICKDAVDLLKNATIAPKTFAVLRKMRPLRQIEASELMLTASNFSVPYAKALLVATPAQMLVDPDKRKVTEGLSPEQVSKMEREMEALQRDLKVVEDSHGNSVLNLVLARGYLSKLFGNQKVLRYLTLHYKEILEELQKIIDKSSLET